MHYFEHLFIKQTKYFKYFVIIKATKFDFSYYFEFYIIDFNAMKVTIQYPGTNTKFYLIYLIPIHIISIQTLPLLDLA